MKEPDIMLVRQPNGSYTLKRRGADLKRGLSYEDAFKLFSAIWESEIRYGRDRRVMNYQNKT